MRNPRRRTLSFMPLQGQRWAMGKTEEDAFKKAEEALGKEWFAITAFPLLAGTFGSIATALNICALVQPWRCEFDSKAVQTDVRDINDPSWLIGMNVVSLVFGVVANVAIMFVRGGHNKPIGRRGLYSVLITIVTGMLASFILTGLVITASRALRIPSPPEHTFTEAYYYAIMAAGLYFVTSAFVIYTAYMLWQSEKSREELSSQFSTGSRSLKMLTILFMAYILLGALVFSEIEGWRYLDGVFWADVTILTIGFGDFRPETHLGRSLLFPFATFGVFILFLIIYSITQVVFQRGKSRWEIRIRDQERIRMLKQRAQDSPRNNNPSLHRSEKGIMPNSTTNNKDGVPSHPTLSVEKHQENRRNEERENRRRDFNMMQAIIQKSQRKRIWYSMALWGFFSMFLWLFGAALFYVSERDQGWSYFDAVYFTFISILAIGYGDESLHSIPGKSIFVLWSLIVVPTLTMLITTGTEAVGLPTWTGTKRWVKRHLLRKEQPPKLTKNLSNSLAQPQDQPHNTHDKNHLLIQAIKAIALDHIKNENTKAPSRADDYSFEDWEYVFYLMDVLEPSVPNGDDAEEDLYSDPLPDVGKQDGEGSRIAQESFGKGKTKTGLEQWRDGEQALDWLHGKNPLNVSETVTEWMLLTLVEKLEGELYELRKQLGNTAEME